MPKTRRSVRSAHSDAAPYKCSTRNSRRVAVSTLSAQRCVWGADCASAAGRIRSICVAGFIEHEAQHIRNRTGLGGAREHYQQPLHLMAEEAARGTCSSNRAVNRFLSSIAGSFRSALPIETSAAPPSARPLFFGDRVSARREAPDRRHREWRGQLKTMLVSPRTSSFWYSVASRPLLTSVHALLPDSHSGPTPSARAGHEQNGCPHVGEACADGAAAGSGPDVQAAEPPLMPVQFASPSSEGKAQAHALGRL